mgnify:CR=1 FL=1
MSSDNEHTADDNEEEGIDEDPSALLSGSSDNDDDDDDVSQQQQQQHNQGAAEAGIVRGVSRSVAQRVAAARTAGRTLGKAARRVPKARPPRTGLPKALPKAGGAARGSAIPRGGTVPRGVIRPPRSGVVPKLIKPKLPKPKGGSVLHKPPKASLPKTAVPKAATPKPPRIPKASAPKPKIGSTRAPPGTANIPLSKRAVPVKRVAKVTDRMSTGIDLLDTATSSIEEKSSYLQEKEKKRSQQLARVGAFAKSLVKNTFIGTIVFESYCWLVESCNHQKTISQAKEADKEGLPSIYKDVFDTVPVWVHYFAGATAGSLQGLANHIWDTSAATISARKWTVLADLAPLSRSMMQHGISHSVLFGSYESLKRLFLWGILKKNDTDRIAQNTLIEDIPQKRIEYFLGAASAGGLAGQFQHASSHILEHYVPGARLSLPTLRSTLWAFPPSAIAFLAFEYGKDTLAELSDDDND